MKKIGLIQIAVFLFIALSINNKAKAYNNTYVVVVAIEDYKNLPSGPGGDLNYTIDDATKFTKFLMSTKGGSVPKENIYFLTEEKAKKANILYYTKKMFSRAKTNDRVIFYFSGHGDVGCFVPYDVTLMGGNLLYFSELKQLFRYAKCTTKLLFADACHAGSLKNSKSVKFQKALKKESNTKSYSNYNIAVMLSSSANETSLETNEFKEGIFTYNIIRGLSGYADKNGNKKITIEELFNYVYKKTVKMGEERGNPQHPVLFGKFDLNLIVARL